MIKYFYILTLSWTKGRDAYIQTISGIATADEGQSQESIYTILFENACRTFDAPEKTSSVTYYYLARNET